MDKTVFIGDDPRDCQAAYNAGCNSLYLGREEEVSSLSSFEFPQWIFNNLEEALPVLEKI